MLNVAAADWASRALARRRRPRRPGQLVVERRGVPAREQAGAAATGDEERDGEAKPAGEQCAGRVAHPRPDFTSLSDRWLGAPTTRSLAEVESLGQRVGQAGRTDRRRGAVDVVLRPLVERAASLGVELEPCRARIAVAWLPDAAGVDQPLARRRPRPPRRRLCVWPVAAAPSGRENDSATCECPIRQTRCCWTSRHSSACSGERTYSQTGSRGLAWKSPTASSSSDGSSSSRNARVSAVIVSCVHVRGERRPARELLERQVAADAEIVVAGQADGGMARARARRTRRARRRSRRGRRGTTSPRTRRPRSRRARPRRRAGCRGCRRRQRSASLQSLR